LLLPSAKIYFVNFSNQTSFQSKKAPPNRVVLFMAEAKRYCAKAQSKALPELCLHIEAKKRPQRK
jgi:hypothetical protein